MTHTELFFKGEVKLGWWFEKPLRLALSLFLCGLGLTVYSFVIGVGHFVNIKGCPVGFIDRPNCAAMYVIILPVLFYLICDFFRLASREVSSLAGEPLRIISKSSGNHKDQTFEHLLQARIASRGKIVFVIALAAAVSVTIVALYLFFVRPSNPAQDWSQAYSGKTSTDKWPSVALDGAVFMMQGIYVFLGLLWAGKTAVLMGALVRLAFRPNRQFELAPIIHDPQKRLGLSPLGVILTRIGLVASVFEVYVAIYSIQDAADHRDGTCLLKYLSETLSPKNTFRQMLGLGHVQRITDFGDAGTIALIVLCLILWSCYTYVPVCVVRPLLSQIRRSTWLKSVRELEHAKNAENEKVYKRLDALFQSLESATFWPNGATVGLGLCLGLLCIPVLAFYPPALGYAIASGVVAASYKAIFGK